MLGQAASDITDSLIKDATDASFMADVVEASRDQPVIVDFWATWCGPCRTLGPMLEKAVTEAKGKVRLVKVDIDKNPRFAGQLRVQSIPAVYAFDKGQPVDGFMGALPESQVKAFVDRLAGGGGPSDIDLLLEEATAAVEAGDLGGAAQAYAEALQLEPTNLKAIAGLAKAYLTGGDLERAAEVAAMAPEDAKDVDLAAVRAALALAAQAPEDAGEAAALQRKVEADPADHQSRFELAQALAGKGELEAAIDHLLNIIEQDRDWNEGAARKQLLTVFEAAGHTSDVTRTGRRKLSAILFS
jgi:putative thioredoxin